MTIFAIGDLHLSHAVPKPMDVFGDTWTNHTQHIESNWNAQVLDTDTVLIPGDISWAMTLQEALPDLKWIGSLPGNKVMIRGNHDYWWNGIGKVRGIMPPRTYAIQNDSVVSSTYSICGTRGWLLPSHPNFSNEDEHMVNREVHRLRLSLEHAAKKGLPIICMIHYPPIAPHGCSTPFTDVIEAYPVTYCIYGHLHGSAHRFATNVTRGTVRYQLVSADYVHFSPVPLLGLESIQT